MQQVILNKKQMAKLVEIFKYFGTADYYKISVDSPSGIGPNISVSMNLFNDSDSNLADRNGDTIIDITDITEW